MFEVKKISKKVKLAPYTTYKIGGLADYFIEVKNIHEFVLAVKYARVNQIPYFVLGTGANILIGDKGFRGLVIKNSCRGFEIRQDVLTAESGAEVSNLIKETTARSLSGLEHFVGIPSTVGGAIWQNLHFLAPDRKTTLYLGDILIGAKVLTADNEIIEVDRNFFKFGYDDSILHHEEIIVLSAIFQLQKSAQAKIEAQIKDNMAWRIAKQPQLEDFPSCGSVFKKIEGVGAGRLIDQAGLKGLKVGQAQISQLHANYFINLGGATAADVLALIKKAQEVVKEKTGHNLELEISLIGEF